MKQLIAVEILTHIYVLVPFFQARARSSLKTGPEKEVEIEQNVSLLRTVRCTVCWS